MPVTFAKSTLLLSLLLGIGGAHAASAPDASEAALASAHGIPHPAVIAHRGASFDAPESTAASYKLARDLGADYLELDLQRSKDGVLFALHDNNLQRTTDVATKFPERKDARPFRLDMEDAAIWKGRIVSVPGKRDLSSRSTAIAPPRDHSSLTALDLSILPEVTAP